MWETLWEALVLSTVHSALVHGFHQPSQLTPVAWARTAPQVPRPCPVSAMCSLISCFPNLSAQSSGLKLA